MAKHCAECHDADSKKGGLDLSALTFDLSQATNFARWVKVHDRVQTGEMPPAKQKERPTPGELGEFTNALAAALTAAEQQRYAAEGRATERRLNRYEYEYALRDLLHAPWLQIRDSLPEDGESHRFNKVGDVLDVSHVQMARYLNAADYALRQVIATETNRPETRTRRYYARDQRSFTGPMKFSVFNTAPERATFPALGTKGQPEVRAGKVPITSTNAELRELEGVGVVASAYEPIEPKFNQFRAPVAGRYKLRLNALTVWVGPGVSNKWYIPDLDNISAGRRPEPVTLYSETPPHQLRWLGKFDVTPEPTVHELDIWLLAGETVRPDASRLFRSRPGAGRWQNPLAEKDGQPGVVFRWLEVEGPIYDEWPPAGHRVLFGDLAMAKKLDPSLADEPVRRERGRRRRNTEEPAARPESNKTDTERPATNAPSGGKGSDSVKAATGIETNRFGERRFVPQSPVEIVSKSPMQDAERLLRNFVQKAYRRPGAEGEASRFLPVVAHALRDGSSFEDALIAAYTGVLCSPGFLYLHENPGQLDDYALASRLSFFLWDSPPDGQLTQLASRGELRRPGVLRRETDRLLEDPRSRRFVDAFLDYWLELRRIVATAPDGDLYPDYYLDDLLTESALEETQLFFAELLRHDLPARTIIDSDFAMLNEKLAAHYGLPPVQGVSLQRVSLPKSSPRGGLMTQASILKVTANGTTTSPVLRGAWIMERILGEPPPPPPPNLPAIDPDTRGAVTIRQQLEKHRTLESCNACHAKIDPAGFALENFDVMGGWRERYRAMGDGAPDKGVGKNGQKFAFHSSLPVDASGQLPDGRKFSDIRELKELLLQDEHKIARNLARQLTVYATGAPVGFADRQEIEMILRRTSGKHYGVRSLIEEIVQSRLFREK